MSFSICGSGGANTGAFQCDRRRSIPKKIIIGGKQFTSGEYGTQSAFDAALIAAFKLATGSSIKLYPFPEITGVSDKTEANKEATLGAFGPKVSLVEGKPAYEFDVIAGSALEKQLRKFNGQQVPVFIVDDSNAVWGKLDSTSKFVGTDVLIFTTPHKFGDGSNGQTTKVSISFVSSADVYDSAAFVVSALSISSMVGLNDGIISEYAAHASNVYKMKVKIATSQAGQYVDVYDYFATELAASAQWVAYTGATLSTPLTITSIAGNAANKGWDITFDTTLYTALAAGAQIKIGLASPAVLDAAGITGLEGVAIITVK
jgi:hypothetical protein